jgi:hypothetical protein
MERRSIVKKKGIITLARKKQGIKWKEGVSSKRKE